VSAEYQQRDIDFSCSPGSSPDASPSPVSPFRIPLTETNLFTPLPVRALSEFGSDMQKILFLTDASMRPAGQQIEVRRQEERAFRETAHTYGYPATKETTDKIQTAFKGINSQRHERLSHEFYSSVDATQSAPIQKALPDRIMRGLQPIANEMTLLSYALSEQQAAD
jgi:hypothetical protein